MNNLSNPGEMPRDERMAHLRFLRETFTGWSFELSDVQPAFRGQRSYLDYADAAAMITEVQGSDPNELAILLVRVRTLEAKQEEGE